MPSSDPEDGQALEPQTEGSPLAVPDWLLSRRPSSLPQNQQTSRRARHGSYLEKTLGGLAHLVDSALAVEATSARTGLLQRLDPRVKLVSFVGLLIVGVLAHSLLTLGALIALSVILALASRLGLRRLAIRAWIFIPLFTAIIALPAITNWVSPGRPLVTFWQGSPVALGPFHLPGTLAITEPGLLSAAHLVLRVTAVVSFAALLTLTTKWNELLKSLRVLRAPKMFVFMLAMAYRYVHLLARLLRDMLLARKSRIVGPSSAAENRRFLGASAAALFGKSQAMGEQVHSAMLARGYQGEVHTLETWHLRSLDLVWALGVAGVFAVTIWLGLAPGRGF